MFLEGVEAFFEVWILFSVRDSSFDEVSHSVADKASCLLKSNLRAVEFFEGEVCAVF